MESSPSPHVKFFSNKDTEIILNYLSHLIEKSSNSASPLLPSDLELKLKYSSSKTDEKSINIRNTTFDSARADFSYQMIYNLFLAEFEHLMNSDFSYNEYTRNTVMSNMKFEMNKIGIIQMNQFGLVKINKFMKFEPYTPTYEDYTVYVTAFLDYLNTDKVKAYVDLAKVLPSYVKNANMIIMTTGSNFKEGYIMREMTQLQGANEAEFEMMKNAYNISYCKKIEENEITSSLYNRIFDNQPFFFLVDKNGRGIKKFRINTYEINESIERVKELENKLKPIPKETCDFLTYLSGMEKKLSKLDYCFNFSYNITAKAKVSDDLSELIPTYCNKISLECELKAKDLEVIKKFQSENKRKNFSFTIKEIPTYSLDFSSLTETKCANLQCNTMITKSSPFYYCYWCKIFYCEKCVEDTFKRETDNLREKYLHKQHNLLYITTTEKEYLTDLTLKHLGKNRFAQVSDSELTLYAETLCSGCAEDIVLVPRYLCVTCRAGKVLGRGFNDYCYTCMEHMRNNDEKGKAMQLKDTIYENELLPNYNAIERKHSHKNHIYLLIITKGGMSYYDY